MRRFSAVAVLALALAACGGGKSNKPITLPDSSVSTPDAAEVGCLIEPSLGAVTPAALEAHFAQAAGETEPTNYYLYADLNADASPDVLLIDLYKDYGAFTAGWPTTTTTIQITGDETNYASCGACLLAFTDYTPQGPTGEPYFATSGTLELTAVNPTTIKGTLTDVAFQHVTIDPDTSESTPIADGCTTTLASLAFEASPVADMLTGRTRLAIKRGR